MRYVALACDYDGTLAFEGRVAPSTIDALVRVRASGRRLFLVSGRHLEDIVSVFPRVDLFDRMVLENGGIVADPKTGEVRPLGPRPPPGFIEALRARGVTPLGVGRVIVDTREPHGEAVLATIRELGLALQVSLNKGAVMILPAAVDKGSGLGTALGELGIDPAAVVGVGDAENDQPLLEACGCAVAVANALPTVRERADWVTRGDHGAGVEELAQALVSEELALLMRR
jgi:hydroxymethylpyrimidine pyrophosphatase-like HAD family hydrolase